MGEGHLRKTQARFEERARRRAERERREKFKRVIPLGLLGTLAVLFAGYVLFGTFRASGTFESPNAKAHFTVDTEKLELGDQKLGHPIKASFTVKNVGDGRLTLDAPPMVKALEGC